MKVMIDESKMSIEYISSVIEDCDANGLMAIADDDSGEIYIFDPKSNLYATSTDLMEADATIDDIIKDEELKNEVMLPAIGDKFKEFAVKWNDLEKKGEDDEVYKTKKCAPIHGNFTESTDESNQINEKIANYESHLRDAAKHIDKAINEISSLSGSSELADIRKNLGDALAVVQFTIRGIYRLYDNPEIMNGIEAQVSEGIENDVIEGIPNWAVTYIMYGEVHGDMTDDDVKLVDDYLRKLDNDGIRLIAPIEGTENEFNPHPAFGDACDTTDWSCEID